MVLTGRASQVHMFTWLCSLALIGPLGAAVLERMLEQRNQRVTRKTNGKGRKLFLDIPDIMLQTLCYFHS